jgi:hypothetical protein
MDNPVYTTMCRSSQRPPLGAILWRSVHRLPPRWSRPSSSSRWRRAAACTHYFNAVRTPCTGTRHMMATSRCSVRCWRRTASPPRRQAGTFNLLLHVDARAAKAARSIGYTAKQGRCPGGVEIAISSLPQLAWD